jgi:hypothetical protein
MMTEKSLLHPAPSKDPLAQTSTHYSTWPPIDLARARKACANGASLFSLPGRYHSDGVVYVAGLKLPRGGSYLVSELIKADLEAEPLTPRNHALTVEAP